MDIPTPTPQVPSWHVAWVVISHTVAVTFPLGTKLSVSLLGLLYYQGPLRQTGDLSVALSCLWS